MEKVILVDNQDKQIGLEEKLEAHRQGKLHRAISVFVFNSKGEMLLQQRAEEKYHSGGLWANTCCSHPREEESVLEAGRRRLNEEMGIECDLKEIYAFIYRNEFENGLTENEFDHVLVGVSDQQPLPDPKEAKDFRWVSMGDLAREIKQHPENFAVWFKIIMDDFIAGKFVL